MKVLVITFEAPSDFSGGGLGVKQSILSLAEKNDVDYIGPIIFDNECNEILDNQFIIESSSNNLVRVYDLLRGITSSYYRSWKKVVNRIDFCKYDVVQVEFTRYNFVTKYIKEKGKKISVRVHNVENDYYKNLYDNNKNLKLLIRKKLIFRQEKECLKDANVVLCLTDKDKKRINVLYQDICNEDKIQVVPVCVKENKPTVCSTYEEYNIDTPYIVATGSFWYGPNVEGMIWFVTRVWSKIYDSNLVRSRELKLVIAGSRPNDKLKLLAKEYDNIQIIENPSNMTNIISRAELFIAPIFNGAGMKVKVAEALSHGLTIVGTDHAFIGYEMIDKVNGYIVNTEDEFIECIIRFFNNEEIINLKMEDEVQRLFNNKYSMKRSVEYFEYALSTIYK